MTKKLSAAMVAKYAKVPVVQGVMARFPRALREIAIVSVFGAKKHEQPVDSMSYLDAFDAKNVYLNAEMRHMLAEATEGPINHEDGNLLHKAQKAWNALADLEVFLNTQTKEEDDA